MELKVGTARETATAALRTGARAQDVGRRETQVFEARPDETKHKRGPQLSAVGDIVRANGDFEMTDNEKKLRDGLATLTKIIKHDYRLLAQAGTRLSALEAAVSGLDPTFDDVMRIKVAEETQANEETIQTMLTHLDLLIDLWSD